MDVTEQAVWAQLEALYSGDLTLEAFERWVYSSKDGEAVLGSDAWLELISRDYRDRYALHDTRMQIEDLYEERRPGQLVVDHARRIAREFLENRRDLWNTSWLLASLHSAGHEWVPLAFVTIASELDDIPAPEVRRHWNQDAVRALLIENADFLEQAHAEAREAAQEVLKSLAGREKPAA